MEGEVRQTKRSFRELDDMWRRGISLSDKDLNDLKSHYTKLINALSSAPIVYKLVLDDAQRQHESVDHAVAARKEKW